MLPEILNCYNSNQTAEQKIEAILKLPDFPKQLMVQFAYNCAELAVGCLAPGSEEHSVSLACLSLVKRWLAGERGEAMEEQLKAASDSASNAAYAASNAAYAASNATYAASYAAYAAYAAYNAAYAASNAAYAASNVASNAAYYVARALAKQNNKEAELYEKQFLEQLFELSLAHFSKNKAVRLLYGS